MDFLSILVIIFYFIGIILLGIKMGGKQSSATDYFLSEKKIHWFVVCLSIVATETSALTFISVPGLAFKGNLNFLQLAIGYILGRILVARYLLPMYYQGELTTAYALIEKKIGKEVRKFSSLIFIITRVLADGVRLYATAVPLVIIFKGYQTFTNTTDDTLYIIAIVFVSVTTLSYVFFGGIRAVLWTDLVQLVIYVLGGLISLFLLIHYLPDMSTSVNELISMNKLEIFSFDNLFENPLHFLWAFIGGAILSSASHGTDQIIVQRIFATKGLKDGQRALIWSGIIVLIQFMLFLLIGSFLYLYYPNQTMRSDEVFVKFIIEGLPHGISGFIIAALLSAAMSTISSSVNAISQAVIFDFYSDTSAGKKASESTKLHISKLVSVFWMVILSISAIFFIDLGKSAVTFALEVASFTYGGLLSLFIIAVFFPTFHKIAVIIGFASSIVITAFIVLNQLIPWTLYSLLGMIIGIIITSLVNLLVQHPNKTLSE